jgi:RNA polymerase sigma factor (sigma-70 family)
MGRVMAGASAGDDAAWALLERRFGAALRAVARSHRLNDHDVDDVVQTTWLRLLEHIGDIRSPDALGAWLCITARRESIRLCRRNGREVPTDADELPVAPVGDGDPEAAAAEERRRAVRGAMEGLSGRRRALMEALVRDPAPSYGEIAFRLGMPVGSIGPTRARCVTQLRHAVTAHSALA